MGEALGVDTDIRLTRAELQLEQHGKMHEETQLALKNIAEAVQKLAQAEVRREQDQETFGRIFKSIEKLRTDFEEYKDDQAAKELAAAKAEIADQSKHIWDIRSMAISAGGMLILWLIAEALHIHIPS